MTSHFIENIVAESLDGFFPSGTVVAPSIRAQALERPFVLVASTPDDVGFSLGFYGETFFSTLEVSTISGNSNEQNWREQHRDLTDLLTAIVFNDGAGGASLRGAINSRWPQATVLRVWPTRIAATTTPTAQIDTITLQLWYRQSGQADFNNEVSPTSGTNYSIRHEIEDLLANRLQAFLPQEVTNEYAVRAAHNDEQLTESRIVAAVSSVDAQIRIFSEQNENFTEGSDLPRLVTRNRAALTEPLVEIKVTSSFTDLEKHNNACEQVQAAISSIAASSASGSAYGRPFISNEKISLNEPLLATVGSREMGEFSVTDSFALTFYGIARGS